MYVYVKKKSTPKVHMCMYIMVVNVQIITVLSHPPEATMFSSVGWYFTLNTRLEWPADIVGP
jgi:hypothetical protein